MGANKAKVAGVCVSISRGARNPLNLTPQGTLTDDFMAQIASLRAQIRRLEITLAENRAEEGRSGSIDSLEGLPSVDNSSPLTSSQSESSRSSGDSKTERDYVSHPILFNECEDGGFDEGEDLVCIKRADLELLYLKERAMDVVHEGITIADASLPDMPLIYINDGFRKITGYPVGAVKNKNCRFLQGKGTDERTVTKLRNAIKCGKPCTVQLMNYRKDGSAFVNNLSVTPIHDHDGKLTHFVGIQSDVTELVQRKRGEAQAKIEAAEAAAATEAKSKFLTRMSHEIRTPLNGMIAVSELLSYTNLTPQQWDLVNTIKCSGDALLSLITDILDFGKIEANKMTLVPTSFYLRSTVEAAMEIAGMHASQKRLHVGYEIADDVPEVIHADPDRLQQVLLNTLNNAAKFTEAGELLLEISTKPFARKSTDTDGRTYPTPKSGETYLYFRVTDTGIGMSETGIDLLFRSFSQIDNTVSTRKYGGSGLGLFISRKLCEAMGGAIWATSPGPGKGSSFMWYIRSTDVSNPSKKKQYFYEKTLEIATDKRVLLLEENAMVRQIVESALTAWGCNVYAAASEMDAMNSIKLVEGAVTDSNLVRGPFDVIIMSIAHKALFSKLLKDRHPTEADRCILFSWPGHVNLNEVDIPISRSNMAYVTVPRPVRQARLQIALQEVLSLNVTEFSATLDNLGDSAEKACTMSLGAVTGDLCESEAIGAPIGAMSNSTNSDSFGSQFVKRPTCCSSGSLLQVPVRKELSTASMGSEPTLEAGNEDKKLLIVEDNVVNMKVAISILKRLGFQDIDTANDGLEALERIQNAGGPQAYHVILMDLHMPNLDGVGAVREIHNLYPNHDTKIIAVTADAFEETRDMTVSVGFSGWLAKPFRVEEFASLMNKF
jgi:PAS domain S-box-containing protein